SLDFSHFSNILPALYNVTVQREDVATSGYSQLQPFIIGSTCQSYFIKGSLPIFFQHTKNIHTLLYMAHIFSDEDECAEGKDNCQQLCINLLPPQSFKCDCNLGYNLTGGNTCVGKIFSLFFYY